MPEGLATLELGEMAMIEENVAYQNPLGLVEVLREYGSEEFGSYFLFLPSPRRAADQEAWAWIQCLRAHGLVRRRWLIQADHVSKLVRVTHPHLFEGSPICFEVYRIDQASLPKLFAKLERLAMATN